jgi:hypothetical protein
MNSPGKYRFSLMAQVGMPSPLHFLAGFVVGVGGPGDAAVAASGDDLFADRGFAGEFPVMFVEQSAAHGVP